MVAAALTPVRDDATVRYWPRGASADLFRHHEPEVIICGAAGTGKTYGSLWRLHLAALKYPGMRGLMVRKTLEALTASALVTFQQRVLGSGRWGVRPFGGSKLKPAGFIYPNGSELLIGGMDKAEKVMSQEYDLIFVNEATGLDEPDWEALTTRARYGVMPYQQVFGDCNPGAPGHWLYRRCHVAGKTTILNSYHTDNPILWDGEDWTAQGSAYLATLANLTGHRRARLLEGLWTAAEGAVYPGFNREANVASVDCDGWATVLGLDVGTRNPTALLTVRYAGDRIHVEQEDYRAGLGSDDISDMVSAEFVRSGASHVVVDPSAAGLIVSLTKRGVKCRRADNDVQEGIRRVTSALPDLTIDPRCEHTIEEHEGYHYPVGRIERDAPVKAEDHTCFVAGTLIETDAGSAPIERIRVGQKVWTRQGYRVVAAAGLMDAGASVVTVHLSNGTRLTGTRNHPIWTDNREWVRLDSLRYDDILYVCDQRPSSTTESSSIAIRNRLTGQIGRTSRRALRIASGALVACTRKSGRHTTARFLRGTTSTISTKTPSTTRPATWPVGPERSIGPTTGRSRRVNAGWHTWITFALLLWLGIGQTRGGRGTGNTASGRGPIVKSWCDLARSVPSRSIASRAGRMIASARTPANQPGDEPLGLTTKNGLARSVGSHSSSIATARRRAARVRVLGISAEQSPHPVYNLAVFDTPEYLANGVLVHNCDTLRYVVMDLTTPTGPAFAELPPGFLDGL